MTLTQAGQGNGPPSNGGRSRAGQARPAWASDHGGLIPNSAPAPATAGVRAQSDLSGGQIAAKTKSVLSSVWMRCPLGECMHSPRGGISLAVRRAASMRRPSRVARAIVPGPMADNGSFLAQQRVDRLGSGDLAALEPGQDVFQRFEGTGHPEPDQRAADAVELSAHGARPLAMCRRRLGRRNSRPSPRPAPRAVRFGLLGSQPTFRRADPFPAHPDSTLRPSRGPEPWAAPELSA